MAGIAIEITKTHIINLDAMLVDPFSFVFLDIG